MVVYQPTCSSQGSITIRKPFYRLSFGFGSELNFVELNLSLAQSSHQGAIDKKRELANDIERVPVMVIATNNMQDLRFYQIGHVAPYQHPMAGFLADRSLWELRPVWTGKLAPGGEWSNYKLILAKVWAYAHSKASKVPTFILLMGSGALVNVLIGFVSQDFLISLSIFANLIASSIEIPELSK